MAFTQETFAPIGGQSTAAPSIWSYITQDTLAETISASYFIDKQYQLNVGDEIFIVAADGGGNYAYTGPTQPLFDVSGGSSSMPMAPTGSPFVGDGSSWKEIGIERLIDGRSVAATQQPSSTGEANQIQIEFGPAIGTGSDPVQLSALGALTINETGLYRVKVSLIYGRTGSAGVSELRFRALVNGVQAGQSIGVDIDNANSEVPYADEAWLELPAGVTITYEIMRDSDGNDSGGLFQPIITAGTAPSWNACSCAAIRVERWRAV